MQYSEEELEALAAALAHRDIGMALGPYLIG